MIKEYKKGIDISLSKNFSTREFDCHGTGCCDKTYIDTDLVGILQQIRANFGKAVTINSGYRCVTHNKAVGGATKSKHMSGTAADIAVSGIKPEEVAKYAESIGVKGIGLYSWGCHIDTRDVKSFWYSDKQEPRTTFGGVQTTEITVLEWQKAAIADGFKFPKYGADGVWGAECESVAKKAVCKKRLFYTNKNLTRLVQRVVGVTADGKFGLGTKAAVIKYQSAHGLTPDGEVGLNTWKTMLGVLAGLLSVLTSVAGFPEVKE